MSISVDWLPDAEANLIEIYITIALENQSAADRIYAAMKKRTNVLYDHPRIGQRRPELAPPARVLIVGSN